MYCQKCGKQMPDNARFCSKCGTPVEAPVPAAAAEQPAAEETKAARPEGEAAPKRERKPVPAKLIGIAAVAVVAALAALLLLPMLGGKGTFDLQKAYSVTVQGVDGYGAVRLTENEEYWAEWFCKWAGLDPEKADLDDIDDPFSAWNYIGKDVEEITEDVFGVAMSEEELEAMMEALEPVAAAFAGLDYEVTPQSDLSNGDKVEIVFDYDEADMKEAGIKLKNTQWGYTVEGLDGVATVDLSAAIAVKIEGYDGYGRLSFALDPNAFDSLGLTEEQREALSYYADVECTKREGLRNGDKVVFNVNANEESLARAAVLIEPTRWEHTVSGLQEVELLDPFEGLKLTCTGISPYLNVSLDTSACESRVQQAVTFTLPEGYARNGKPVSVTASIEDALVEQYGFGLSVESKDIALSVQPEYVTSLDGLDLTALLQELEDAKLANTADYSNVIQRDSAFLYLKEHKEDEADSDTPYNCYTILFESDPRYTWDDKIGHRIRAWNLCKHPDGSLTWDSDIRWDYNEGYDAAYKKFIDSYRENYVVTNIR